MSADSDPLKGIENRFRHLSVQVREERVIRYIIHQVQQGRHVNDIVNDPYLAAHFDEAERARIIENPEVIKALEEQIRREFADYGGSMPAGKSEADGGDQEPLGQATDARMSDL